MEYKKLTMGGYNLHLIKTDKFKSCHIEVIFHNNVNVKDITKRQMLTRMLNDSNKTYPTNRQMHLKLEDLYDANYYAFTSKVGNMIITNIAIDYLNPIYSEKGLSKECIKFLFDMILNPLVNLSEFDNKTFNIIKKRLKDSINSAFEDVKRLSVINALKFLGDSPSAYSNLGNINDLEEVNPNNLYEYYEEMLKNDYIDIYVIGNIEMDEITKYINEYAKFNVIKNHKVNLQVINPKIKTKVYSDKARSIQSNLVIVLNLNNLSDYEKRYVANLYNLILGQSSVQNKLFKKLREENSLCYSISSYYQKYDGLIVISTGVDAKDENKAIKLIKECLKEMNNKISDDEIDNAKKQVITSLLYAKDSLDRIIDNYFYQDLKELDDIDTRIKVFKKVSKEEIYDLSKRVSISIIYTLKGDNNE